MSAAWRHRSPLATSEQADSLVNPSADDIMRTIQLSVVAAAVSLALAGCGALGPNYERPAQTLPTAAIKPQSSHTSATVDWLARWKGFQDPTLDALLDEARANSADLALAAARIEESRAQLALTHASRFPTVDANLRRVALCRSASTPASCSPGANPRYNDFQPGITAAFEIDFWGKVPARRRGRGALHAGAGSRPARC